MLSAIENYDSGALTVNYNTPIHVYFILGIRHYTCNYIKSAVWISLADLTCMIRCICTDVWLNKILLTCLVQVLGSVGT